MRTHLRLLATLLSLTLFLVPLQLQGQAVNATLVGTVSDPSGAVLTNANVTITEVSTGLTRSAKTNDSGNYVFPNLPPGTYKVSIESQGFKRAERSGAVLDINSTVRVDVTLVPGAASEVVNVTETTAILQTERADVGQKIEAAQLAELPVGGPVRNFQGLLGLVPGTVRPHRDHSEFFNSQDSLSSEVNGQSREFNQLSIEGVNNDERTGLLQIYIPPSEAIQTVDITTSNYTAEFGRAAGAVTNVVLKSGSNQFHGSAYEYNRVSALAARAWANRAPNPVPRTTYNYYGASIGGPIIKNKTFFFFDILHISDVRGQFNLFSVPTVAMRGGDLSASTSPIYNPYSGASDGSGRVRFQCDAAGNPLTPNAAGIQPAGTACNKIPAQLISPITAKILALVPAAQSTALTNNLSVNTQLRKTPTSFDVKVDHNWTASDRLAFRFSRSVQDVFQQPAFGIAGGPANGGFQGTGLQHEQSGALNETHIFSPTLVMELRGGISHYRNIAQQSDYGTDAAAKLGITGANLDNGFTSGMASIDVQGGISSPLVGYSASQPWDRGEVNLNVVNTWTKVHGNHTFKWGADIRRLRDELVQGQSFSPRGLFRFGSGTTQLAGQSTSISNNIAALLLDFPTEVGRDIAPISGSWRETEMFFFGQDTWHATSKLTVDAGLRWELYRPPTPSKPGRWSNYDPSRNVLVQAGIENNPLNLGREFYKNNFAPRLGLAYRVGDKMVVRAGFGISYAPFTNNQYAFNYPLRSNQDSTTVNATALPFLQGVQVRMATGIPAAPTIAVLPGGLVTPRPAEAYNVIDKHFQQPYVESYNLSVQRSLPWKFVLDMAYVGNHGVRIPVAYDLNAICAVVMANETTACANHVSPAVNTTTGAVLPTCQFRLLCNQLPSSTTAADPAFGAFGRTAGTTFLFKPTTSNYNALQVKLDRRFTGGLLLKTAYTFGKQIAFRADAGADDGGGDRNYLDFARNRSILSRNRMHTFVQSFVYELPFGQGKRWATSGPANWVFGNWGLSGIITRMSGVPLHFTASGTSLNSTGTFQTPIQVAPFHILSGIGGINSSSFWFDTSAFCPVQTTAATTLANGTPVNSACTGAGGGDFTAAIAGKLGNMPRYAFHGPGFFNFDAAVFRRFPIREKVGLEFRLEAFGVTNTPQYNNPNTDITSSNFGKITNADTGARSLEMSARITF